MQLPKVLWSSTCIHVYMVTVTVNVKVTVRVHLLNSDKDQETYSHSIHTFRMAIRKDLGENINMYLLVAVQCDLYQRSAPIHE